MGTRIDVRHLAATPVGMRAPIRATLREVDGRRLVFDIEGHDEAERIVEGTHERFQIDQARFLARVAAKGRAHGASRPIREPTQAQSAPASDGVSRRE